MDHRIFTKKDRLSCACSVVVGCHKFGLFGFGGLKRYQLHLLTSLLSPAAYRCVPVAGAAGCITYVKRDIRAGRYAVAGVRRW